MNKYVRHPLCDKDINVISGVGKMTSCKLRKHGYTKAYQLLGQYLLLNKDKQMFIEWLEYVTQKKSIHHHRTAEWIYEWCHYNL